MSKGEKVITQLLHDLPMPVVVCSTDGKIYYANEIARVTFTSKKKLKSLEGDLFSEFLQDFVLVDENNQLVSSSHLLLRNTSPKLPSLEITVKFTNVQTREDKWYKIRSTRITIEHDKSAVVCLFSDQTELKQNEAKYKFLTYASSNLVTSLNYDERLQRLANIIVPTYADWCTIDSFSDDGLQNLAIAHQKWPLSKKLELITPNNQNIL